MSIAALTALVIYGLNPFRALSGWWRGGKPNDAAYLSALDCARLLSERGISVKRPIAWDETQFLFQLDDFTSDEQLNGIAVTRLYKRRGAAIIAVCRDR